MNYAKYIGGKACAKKGKNAYKFGKIVGVNGNYLVIQLPEGHHVLTPAQDSVIMLKGNK